MLTLGLETATNWGTIAVCEAGEPIIELTLKIPKGGGEYLLSILESLLAKTGRTIAEIGLVAVGTGPGSYTGIRVGIAACQGLAEGLGVPLIGVSTLRIIAENCNLFSGLIAPMLDARRGEIYTALYLSSPQGLIEVESPMVIKADQFQKSLIKLGEVMVCGNACRNYQELWINQPGISIAAPDLDHPSAVKLAGIASSNSNYILDSYNLKPCYLRRVEAEIRLEERLYANNSGRNEIGGPK